MTEQGRAAKGNAAGIFMQALRMTSRDWRAGELRFLLLALVIAIASLSSVGFFVDRVRGGLERDAHQLLGADVVVGGDRELPHGWTQQAQLRGLQTAQTVSFLSMAITGDGDDAASRLVAIKAVSAGYPLRGRLRLKDGKGEREAAGVPAPGTAWVDPGLLDILHLSQGGQLKLGDATFTVAGVIAAEPDRGASFMNFAPRVMISLPDLAATRLIQEGSRAGYRLLVAGGDTRVAGFREWAEKEIKERALRGVRIESFDTGRPEMRATLDRAERFLSLASLLSAVLAAVAVALATRRFVTRHLDACAMLRCLGLTQNEATLIYLHEFLVVGLAGAAIGLLLGFGAHFVLLEWLGSLLAKDLPPATLKPALQGAMFGLLLLIGFSLPPLLQLRNVPHNRVIRREREAPKPHTLAAYLMGGSSLLCMFLWQAGSMKLGALTAAGFAGCVVAFWIAAYLALRALTRLQAAWTLPPAWRLAFNSLYRRRATALLQITALSIGLTALLLLTVIRADLVSAWKRSVPPDAPNHFIINIQPDQKDEMARRLAQAGVAKPVLYPMIRGRLVGINGRTIGPASFAEDRAQRLVEREFNLSTTVDIPPGNRIAAGRWYGSRTAEASVESGLAQTLHLKLGDRLAFDAGGQQVAVTVTSIRKLDWSSMQVNFFVILDPASASDLPATWITAFYVPDHAASALDRLVRDFPNITLIDTGAMVAQVQNVIDQVVTAVEFVFLFALVAGLLVLYAALNVSQEERIREAGMLRVFGATSAELAKAQSVEFMLAGMLAGVLSASGAVAVGWLLSSQVFELEWSFEPMVWLAAIVAGIVCAFAGGTLALRSVLRHPPLHTLREA